MGTLRSATKGWSPIVSVNKKLPTEKYKREKAREKNKMLQKGASRELTKKANEPVLVLLTTSTIVKNCDSNHRRAPPPLTWSRFSYLCDNLAEKEKAIDKM